MNDIKQFDFILPEELIAQTPMNERDHSRLLVINKKEKTYEDKHFFDILSYLKKGDVLVRNNTKVIPARLLGIKEVTHAHCEVLLLHQIENEKDNWEVMCRPAKSIKEGTIIDFGDGLLKGECIKVMDEGLRIFHFIYQGIFMEILDKLGKMPLPPYIKSQLKDNDRYQTVYAKIEGSAAAPTAGFHFTEQLFEKIKELGVEVIDITLHIGLGTFRPVKVDDIDKHIMHEEVYEISEEAANRLNLAKKENRRIIAIGTTSTRTLESNYQKYHKFTACKESTNIFIKPGYKFLAIDGLITNFHLPKSTLVMLVSAFMGLDFTMEVYSHAIENRYRFFSFGDSMFIHE
ncbi:MAG: tRNA preQ1(34) S-adenosylmethionine ribosyltransferase-isomerase QueA [Bacilli bacterium]